MNEQVMHVYTQKHELNNDVSRLDSFVQDIKEGGDETASKDFVVLIDCSQ